MCLFIHYLIDICGVSTLWLLWIVLVWICGFSCTCVYLNNYSQFVEGWYEGVELWGYIILLSLSFCLVQFSHSVVFNSLPPHEPQHARPPCPSPAPGIYPNSCPLSWWCHPTISSCHPLLLLPSIFPSIRLFSFESAFHIRWPKYWSVSFNISTSIKTEDWSL